MVPLFIPRVRERLPTFEAELLWASGDAPPPDKKRRPEWLKCVVRHLAKVYGLAGLVAGQTTITPNALGQLAGLATAADLILNQPSAEVLAEESSSPPIKELRRVVAKATAKPGKIVRRLLTKMPVRGSTDAADNVTRYLQGTVEGMQRANTDTATLTDELCFWLWLFWPEADTAKTRKDLHQWLTDMKFVSCSFKLVEKVCRQIGFRSKASRTKKKQPTNRRKRVGRRSK